MHIFGPRGPQSMVRDIVPGALFIDAAEEAMKPGSPILSNIILLGALSAMAPSPSSAPISRR